MSAETSSMRPPNRQAELVGWGELLRALISKELKVKYKRSVLGFFWSLLTPIALTGVYLFVFIHVWEVDKPDFVLFLLSGLLPWQFFNMSILSTTGSLVENGALIRKVYFPRILLPLASVMSNLINLLIALGLFSILVIGSGRPLWAHLHWVLLAIVLETALCIGLALFLSMSNVYFRDIQQIISILILVLFFGTPIVYEMSQVKEIFRPIILANPMSGIMEIYRAAFFRAAAPDPQYVFLAIIEVAVILAIGYGLFQALSPNLAKEV